MQIPTHIDLTPTPPMTPPPTTHPPPLDLHLTFRTPQTASHTPPSPSLILYHLTPHAPPRHLSTLPPQIHTRHCTFPTPVPLPHSPNSHILISALDTRASPPRPLGTLRLPFSDLLALTTNPAPASFPLEGGPAHIDVIVEPGRWRRPGAQVALLMRIDLMRKLSPPVIRLQFQRCRANLPGSFVTVCQTPPLRPCGPDWLVGAQVGYDLLCNRDAAGARDVRTHVRIVALVVEKKRRGGSEVLRQVGWFDTCLEKLFCQGGGGVREPFELNDVVEGGGIGACGPLDRGGARSSRGGGVAVKDFKICFPDVALGL